MSSTIDLKDGTFAIKALALRIVNGWSSVRCAGFPTFPMVSVTRARLVRMCNVSAPTTRMATAAVAHAPRTNVLRARRLVPTVGSGSGASGRNRFKCASKRSSSRVGTRILLREHRVAYLGKGIAVSRCYRVRANIQQVTYLREGEFAPYVQNHDLSLIIRKSPERTPQIPFSRIVSVCGLNQAESGSSGAFRSRRLPSLRAAFRTHANR